MIPGPDASPALVDRYTPTKSIGAGTSCAIMNTSIELNDRMQNCFSFGTFSGKLDVTTFMSSITNSFTLHFSSRTLSLSLDIVFL